MASTDAQRRLRMTLGHLQPEPLLVPLTSTTTATTTTTGSEEGATAFPAAGGAGEAFYGQRHLVGELTRLLDGDQGEVIQRLRQQIQGDGELRWDVYQMASIDEQRDANLGNLKRLWAASGMHLRDLQSNVGRFVAAGGTLAFFDQSVVVKLGVQISLWGATVLMLGTERHQALLEPISRFELPGCFGMTELGHGSNVRGVATTATWDAARGEFVLESPDRLAKKYWIGGAARHAVVGTMYANLVIHGENKGVHAFVVPLRDAKTLQPLPGVTLIDCGHKLGLQAIDNGGIAFRGVRIPRENLLNRFADVTADGKYVCQLADEGKHFAATVGALVAGRIYIGYTGLSAGKLALAIAVRHGATRRQFGPPGGGGGEVPVLTYGTHQRRLMPLVARCYALDALTKAALRAFGARSDASMPEVHALCAGLKAVSTWHGVQSLQTARECMGGQGLRSKNRIGIFKADTEVWTTFEGDNTVLMVQVTRFLHTHYAKAKQSRAWPPVLAYLGRPAAAAAAPATAGPGSGGLLGSIEWLRSALEFREGSLLGELDHALGELRTKQALSAYDAWNRNLPLIVRTAWAHMDRVAFEALAGAAAHNAALHDVLALLVKLDALVRIEADLGWFVANDFVPHRLAKEIPAAVDALCAAVTDISRTLVDGFGIPARCLPDETCTEE